MQRNRDLLTCPSAGRLLPATLWVIALCVYAGCTRAVQPTAAPSAASRAAAQVVPLEAPPPLTVVDKAAFQQAVDSRRGKIVLVDYWATWCDPCRRQFPHTVALWHKYRNRGVDCLSLSFDDPSDPQGLAEVSQFLVENGAGFEHLISKLGSDEAANIEFDFDGALPHYVIYDRAGHVAKHIAPSDPTSTFRPEMIDEAIEELLARDAAPSAGDGQTVAPAANAPIADEPR